jgi:HSP20 family protein
MSLIPRRNREGRQGELSPMVALRSEMDRLFDTFLREPLGMLDWPLWGSSDKWAPAVDVIDGEKELTVRAELPGIDPKDLDVKVVGDQIVISGEKRESTETKEKNRFRSETRYGSFQRVVPLPEGIDTEHVEAEYAHGVLTLRLPKTAPPASKKIDVKVK